MPLRDEALETSAPLAPELLKAVELRLGSRLQPGLRSLVVDCARTLVGAGAANSVPELTLRVMSAPHTDPVVQRVLQAACIGETYFFRHREQLEALRLLVERHLVKPRRARGLRRLKVWSAACASGEEAYTLAVLFAEAFPDFSVQVVGTDINAAALALARRAVYSGRSFRELDPADCPWLTQDALGWQVRPEHQQRVSLHPLNLVTDPLPCAEKGLNDVDVVVCRNVLIYIEPAKIPAVMARIAAAAAPRAVLALSPAEYTAAAFAPGFVGAGGGLWTREHLPAPRVSPKAPPAEPRALPPAPSFARPPPVASPPAPHRELPAANRSQELLTEARAAADRGDLELASLRARGASACAPHQAAPRYWLAVFGAAKGELDLAVAEFQRALFLERSLVAAEIGLGDALVRQGHVERAGRHLRRARTLLEPLPRDAVVEELEVTVEVARRLVESALLGSGAK